MTPKSPFEINWSSHVGILNFAIMLCVQNNFRESNTFVYTFCDSKNKKQNDVQLESPELLTTYSYEKWIQNFTSLSTNRISLVSLLVSYCFFRQNNLIGSKFVKIQDSILVFHSHVVNDSTDNKYVFHQKRISTSIVYSKIRNSVFVKICGEQYNIDNN